MNAQVSKEKEKKEILKLPGGMHTGQWEWNPNIKLRLVFCIFL
jgi:hypothetical protein